MHQKCTAMTAMYFATLYNVYCECQIFVSALISKNAIYIYS